MRSNYDDAEDTVFKGLTSTDCFDRSDLTNGLAIVHAKKIGCADSESKDIPILHLR